MTWFRNPRAFLILPSFLMTWGWWNLVLDLFRWKKTPYRFGRRMMRPNTTDCWIYTEVCAGQCYRPALPFLKTARCIVDIGANVGFFAQWARKHNPTAKIHLFEPVSGNSDRCLLDSQMVLHKAAVSDYSGQMPVSIEPDLNYGSGHLAAGHFSSSDPHPPITVVDARSLFDLCGTKAIDVLKLDCEGAELGILRRINLLAVRCVILEYHRKEELPQIQEVLRQNRFEITRMDEYHRIICAVNQGQPRDA